MPCKTTATGLLEQLEPGGLIARHEVAALERLFAPEFAFAPQVAAAESLHVHLKVDDTQALPRPLLARLGARLDHEQPGFVKFCCDGGINLIFSSIAVSQDELAESTTGRRPRPFVDHLGIDLRAETPVVQALFDAIPPRAEQLRWPLVSQGGVDRGVHCCHVEVQAKHWVFPRTWGGSAIPLEFAFGALKVNPVSGGCDLRPQDPEKAGALNVVNRCCS